jgi:hypothetical protein
MVEVGKCPRSLAVNRRTALRYLVAAVGGVVGGAVVVNWKPWLSAVLEEASPYCRQCQSAEHVGRVYHLGCFGPRPEHMTAEQLERDRKWKEACERENPYFVGSPQEMGKVPRWGCHKCNRTWGRQPDQEATGWLTAG